MNDLLQHLMQKTGLTQEAAQKVVDVILILRAFPNAQVQLAPPYNFGEDALTNHIDARRYQRGPEYDT